MSFGIQPKFQKSHKLFIHLGYKVTSMNVSYQHLQTRPTVFKIQNKPTIGFCCKTSTLAKPIFKSIPCFNEGRYSSSKRLYQTSVE